MTRFKILLIGTSLSFIPTLSLAQCVATQDCATLGYTETSCNGGKGVKCPFGNKWACFNTDTCEANGFKFSCVGSGFVSGIGDSCGNKYKKCTCSTDYLWDDTKGCITDPCAGYITCKYGCRGDDVCGNKCKVCLSKICDKVYTGCTCIQYGSNGTGYKAVCYYQQGGRQYSTTIITTTYLGECQSYASSAERQETNCRYE